MYSRPILPQVELESKLCKNAKNCSYTAMKEPLRHAKVKQDLALCVHYLLIKIINIFWIWKTRCSIIKAIKANTHSRKWEHKCHTQLKTSQLDNSWSNVYWFPAFDSTPVVLHLNVPLVTQPWIHLIVQGKQQLSMYIYLYEHIRKTGLPLICNTHFTFIYITGVL